MEEASEGCPERGLAPAGIRTWGQLNHRTVQLAPAYHLA
jgi:hypothetical protein